MKYIILLISFFNFLIQHDSLSYLAIIFVSLIIFILFIDKVGIKFLAKLQGKSMQSRVDLVNHESKKNTPSAGGILIVSFTTILSLIICNFKDIRSFLFLFLGYFLVGLIDDVLKVKKSSKYGFKGKYKLLCECIIAYIFLYLLKLDYANYITTSLRISTDFSLDLGIFFIPFVIFIIVGLANSTNLTDGLDGLVTVPVIFSLNFFILILKIIFNTDNTALSLNQILSIEQFIGILIASCVGFLLFNLKPARIFMGDCGSLALGGIIGGLAIFLHVEILMIFVGFIFLIETLSVIIQVVSFKLRKKRVFKIAPIHHHYEALGFSEQQIVYKFWLIAYLSGFIGIELYTIASSIYTFIFIFFGLFIFLLGLFIVILNPSNLNFRWILKKFAKATKSG